MLRSQRSDAARRGAMVGALTLALGACALEDGQPWGRASFELTVELDTPEDRLDDEGRVVTANDYAVMVEQIDVTTRAFEVRMAQDDAEGFDPAAPPPGYSLCHNGHCHADDGSLVDYATIAAELAGGAVQGPDLSVPAAATVTVRVGEPAPLPIDPCATGDVTDCDLPRGAFNTLSLVLGEVRVQGQVIDRRTGDRARLEGPLEIDVVVPAGLVAEAALDGRVDSGRAVEVILQSALVLPGSVFDRVEWDTMGSEDAAAAIAAELNETDILVTEVTR